MRVGPGRARIGAVVVHEAWHLAEARFEVREHRSYLRFQQELGALLGIEQLGLAIEGDRSDAPDAWRHARARLEDEVSTYSVRSRKEATAELFTAWWFGLGGPLVEEFGPVLQRWIPVRR